MTYTGISALIGLQLEYIIPKRNQLLTSILIGAILPDLDLIINYAFIGFNFIFGNNILIFNSVFHSIFIIPFLSLLILIYSELNKKNDLSNVALGLSIGIGLHIALDIITLQSVAIFSPFFIDNPLNLKQYLKLEIPDNLQKLFYALNFLFFRAYAWFLIQKIVLNPCDNHRLINKINIWMKIQLYIFLLFLLLIYYFNVSDAIFMYIFTLLYTSSLLIVLYITYKIRKSIN